MRLASILVPCLLLQYPQCLWSFHRETPWCLSAFSGNWHSDLSIFLRAATTDFDYVFAENGLVAFKDGSKFAEMVRLSLKSQTKRRADKGSNTVCSIAAANVLRPSSADVSKEFHWTGNSQCHLFAYSSRKLDCAESEDLLGRRQVKGKGSE